MAGVYKHFSRNSNMAEKELLLVRLDLKALPAVPALDNALFSLYLMVAERADYGAKVSTFRAVFIRESAPHDITLESQIYSSRRIFHPWLCIYSVYL